VNPVLIGRDDVIIAGHGRLLAARRLGMAEVPIIVLDHLTEAQGRALVIADNRIAENAGWDEELLRAIATRYDKLACKPRIAGQASFPVKTKFRFFSWRRSRPVAPRGYPGAPGRGQSAFVPGTVQTHSLGRAQEKNRNFFDRKYRSKSRSVYAY